MSRNILVSIVLSSEPILWKPVVALPVDVPDTQPESGVSIALLDTQEVTEIWGVW